MVWLACSAGAHLLAVTFFTGLLIGKHHFHRFTLQNTHNTTTTTTNTTDNGQEEGGEEKFHMQRRLAPALAPNA